MRSAAFLAGILTLFTLVWLGHGLGFLEPYQKLIIREYWCPLLGCIAGVWLTCFAPLQAMIPDDQFARSAHQLATLDRRFKAGQLPLKRQQ